MTSETTQRRSPTVREVECKSLLNRSKPGSYTMNCYVGCAHGCVYCYARFMQRFHPHPEPWGEFVDVKVNAPQVLAEQVERLEPGSVFTSSACDGWQPIEKRRRLTRRCCEILMEAGFTVHALTKSALVLRDLEVLRPGQARVGVTITTLSARLKALWEPGASSVERRWGVLRLAGEAGLETAVMFGPILPELSDRQESLDAMFERAAEVGVDVVWVDAMNPRPRVWPSVGRLLRRHFPELHDQYSRILHHEPTRRAYVDALHERVRKAARRAGIEDRLVR